MYGIAVRHIEIKRSESRGSILGK